jgi:hypothetical protein
VKSIFGLLGCVEEETEACRVPSLDAVGLLPGARWVGGIGRVSSEASPSNGVLECR